jgi:arsenate reductase
MLRLKTIMYFCVHNAGRSQMAEAFTNHLAKERGLAVRALSAGTVGGEKIYPAAVAAMEDISLSMEGQQPKQLTQAMADGAARIITMGCGVEANACPARIHLSIHRRVDMLLSQLTSPPSMNQGLL